MMMICASRPSSLWLSGLLLLFFSSLSLPNDVNEADVLCVLTPIFICDGGYIIREADSGLVGNLHTC